MLCNLSKHNTTYTIQIQTLSREAETIAESVAGSLCGGYGGPIATE